MQPCCKIPHAVDEDPERAGPSHKEALPPPVIVLVAKLHICCNDGHLADRDGQDGADDAEKAKDVVVAALVLPDAFEYKEQLDEEYCEWDQSSKERCLPASCIPRRWRDLSWSSVGLGRMFPGFGPGIAIPTTRIYQR